MALKIPPPPNLATQDQQFNRWLLELTSILNEQGLIDPTQIAGFGQAIVALQSAVTFLTTQLALTNATLNAQGDAVTALQARATSYNGIIPPNNAFGVVGDWWADTAGHHIYVKTGAAVWTLVN